MLDNSLQHAGPHSARPGPVSRRAAMVCLARAGTQAPPASCARVSTSSHRACEQGRHRAGVNYIKKAPQGGGGPHHGDAARAAGVLQLVADQVGQHIAGADRVAGHLLLARRLQRDRLRQACARAAARVIAPAARRQPLLQTPAAPAAGPAPSTRWPARPAHLQPLLRSATAGACGSGAGACRRATRAGCTPPPTCRKDLTDVCGALLRTWRASARAPGALRHGGAAAARARAHWHDGRICCEPNHGP